MNYIEIKKGVDSKIIVRFHYNPEYVEKVKLIRGHRWNPEGKYWSFPYSNGIITEILRVFGKEKVNIDSALRKDLTKTVDLKNLHRELKIRMYSPKTIKAYIHYNEDLLQRLKKSPEEVNNNDIKEHLLYLADEKGVSTSTINSVINALKFLYGTVLNFDFIYDIKRPRKDKKLPVILNQEEILRIFSSVNNIKHKVLLMLIYSAGLRVSEVVKLEPDALDAERKLIHIKVAKGRKDRHTMLSDVALETTGRYLKEYGQSKWLFPGQDKGKHITTRTVEKIFSNACKKANIKKNVTVHSLRHSFATHLLESGTDLRYIQELLGHTSSKTPKKAYRLTGQATEIYTHVSNKNIGKIRSPLDRIQIK